MLVTRAAARHHRSSVSQTAAGAFPQSQQPHRDGAPQTPKPFYDRKTFAPLHPRCPLPRDEEGTGLQQRERTRERGRFVPHRLPLAAGHRRVRSAAPRLTVPYTRRRLSPAALTRPACRGSPPRRRLAAAPAGPGPQAAVGGTALQSPQPRRTRRLAAPPPPRPVPAPPARPPPAPPLPPPTGCRAHSVHREGGGDTGIAGAACSSASKCSARHPPPSLRPLLIHSQKEKMAPDLPQEVTLGLICMPCSQPIRRDFGRGSHWPPRRSGRGWGTGLRLEGLTWALVT